MVPKSPEAAAVPPPLAVVLELPFEVLPLDRLHPAAIVAMTISGTHQRNALMQNFPSPESPRRTDEAATR
jgi:hypothetical protein